MNSVFPPPYTVRISKRARRPGLRIRPGIGLEVIIPLDQQHIDIPQLVNTHSAWIQRHYKRVMERATTAAKIEHGFFIGGGREFISFANTPLSEERLRELASTLLPGVATPRVIAQRPIGISIPPVHKQTQLVQHLRRWVMQEASRIFSPQLRLLAGQNGLSYNRCVFKLQKTRWGSCSSKKNININANILFLPPPLARYILIHELCHLSQLNHSPEFWQAVFKMDSQAMRHDRALRHTSKYIPWES